MTKYAKGMMRDTTPQDQPEGTWRYARNATVKKHDGGISNEGGVDRKIRSWNNEDNFIGKIEISDGRVILFAQHDAQAETWSGILLYNGDDDIQLVFSTNIANMGACPNVDFDLNFQREFPIEGTYRIDSRNHLIIYWTDDNNPPRTMDVTRKLQGSLNDIYGLPCSQSPDKNFIDRLNLFPHSGPVPRIDFNAGGITSGGGLRSGVYYLALAYVDEDLISTNYLTCSLPVSIVEESQSVVPIERHDGCPAGTQTGKAITWDISNVNTDYRFFRPMIIRKMGGALEAFQMKDTSIQNNNNTITFTGLEGYAPGALEEVMVDTVAYDTAKTLEQLDGVLYVGNTTRTTDIGYQRYANNIRLSAGVAPMLTFDPFETSNDNLNFGYSNETEPFAGLTLPDPYGVERGYRGPNMNTNNRGYMRDEVYAFYIAFILNDGSMSYAYHIPGRAARGTELNLITNTAPSGGGYASPGDDALWEMSSGQGRQFHFYDTSDAGGNNGMNYWENENEFYPAAVADPDNNWQIWTVTGANVGQATGNTLHGQHVRHHHFGSNESQNWRVICGDTLGTVSLVTTSSATVSRMEWLGAASDISSGSMDQVGYGCCSAIQANGCQTIEDMCGSAGNWSDPSQSGTNFSGILPSTGAPFDCSGIYGDIPSSGDCVFCKTLMSSDQNIAISGGTWQSWAYGQVDLPPNGSGCGECLVIHVDPDSSSNNNCECCDIDWGGPSPTGGTWTSLLEGMGWNFSGMPYSGWNCDQSSCGNGGIGVLGLDGMCDGTDPGAYGYCEWFPAGASILVGFNSFSGGGAGTCGINRLGFSLDQIQIPQDIYDQIQGFRIYYAERDHSNRRVLGQNPFMPMRRLQIRDTICENLDWDPGSSIPPPTGQINAQKIIWYKDPLPYNGIGNSDQQMFAFSFHDFYLLNSHESLSHATHIKVETLLHMWSWSGDGVDNRQMYDNEGNVTAGDLTTCLATGVFASYHMPHTFECAAGDCASGAYSGNFSLLNVGNATPLNRPIKEKCKNYLRGDSWFKAKPLGFGHDVYNEHGEDAMIGQVLNRRAVGLPTIDPAEFALVNTDYAVGIDFSWRSQDAVKIWQGNLHAFKQDMYNAIDTNELIWTGYQVDATSAVPIDRFLGPNTQSTGLIFGGDTFIARHGWRSTIRPKFTTAANWLSTGVQGGTLSTTPSDVRAVYQTIVECSDNINFRHMGQRPMGKDGCHPTAPAQDLLLSNNNINMTFNAGDKTTSHILYNEDYSSLGNIRTPVPFPTYDVLQNNFPTRVHRSVAEDTTSIVDNFRYFKANQYKDLPKAKGELWGITPYNNLLYFHMEKTLYKTKGKQTMQMGDGSEAFVGSGDIFQQAPEEILQTGRGYGGTQSQFARLVCRHGYFFVDQLSRKVFLLTDQLMELNKLGMDRWFKENIKWELENYGFNPVVSAKRIDNPYLDMGFTSTWDAFYDRILLTKHELAPTLDFKRLYTNGTIDWDEDLLEYVDAAGTTYPIDITTSWSGTVSYNGGEGWGDNPDDYPNDPTTQSYTVNSLNLFTYKSWTISYFPEMNIWVSFHDYSPAMYINSNTSLYSTIHGDPHIHKHHSHTPGLYPTFPFAMPFEFEFIDTQSREETKNYFNFSYNAKVTKTPVFKTDAGQPFGTSFGTIIDGFEKEGTNDTEYIDIHHPGFDGYFVYNDLQTSGRQPIVYMGSFNVEGVLANNGTRKIGRDWQISGFRDLSIKFNSQGYYEPYYTTQFTNDLGIAGIETDEHSVLINMENEPLLNEESMFSDVNLNYLDLSGTEGLFGDGSGQEPWHRRGRMKGNWMGIRLYATNEISEKTDSGDRKNPTLHATYITLLSTKVGAKPYKR